MSTALAQAPTADATRLLYERHSSRIFGFCLSRLGSREEAEDALQTTFLNAQRGLGRGVVPDYELAWLFKIAQNVCRNRHQSARRRGRVEATQDLDALQDVLATPERGSAVSLADLTRALSAVPERQRRALLLREFQGLSYEEISVELGVSVAAVETLIFRARRSVAAELGRVGTKPSRRRAVASIAELFGWFFRGGGAPVKLAVAAATVATTATLAVAPVVQRDMTPPPAPKPVTATKIAPAVKLPQPTGRTPSARPSSPVSSIASPAATAPAVRTGSSPVRSDPPPPVPPATSTGSAPPPVLPVPLQVSVPDVPSTPALTVPTVDPGLSLPALVLPDVQVTLPPLPPTLP
ncbi:MAG TPA: sigma-70 family RNA polymerase sigma factor [Gaiellaceae bacterium]